jgi:hypothetical protein
LPKGHVWRLTFVSCCRRRPIGRREFDLSMSDGIPSFRGGNPSSRPPPHGGLTRVGFFRHDTDPSALLPLPKREGRKTYPRKLKGRVREGMKGAVYAKPDG